LHSFLGARFKGLNGGVAVGLPHRNYSFFKQTPINQREEKGRIRMDPRFSARVTKAWWLLSVILRESGESRNTNSKGTRRAPAD
jgi:hypothetical protein